ncbi:MAG TPA: peptidylprolyl isomerase, partial [Polyangiaceae bacterium]|nr:peptidylprolyl isomerase [Polyangiaceae bacterium]
MNAGRGTARAALGVLFALMGACSERAAPKLPEQRLPPGVVAVVGGERIAAGTVARIAARGEAPLEARRRAIEDALFAAAARQNPALAARVRVAERGVLARALLERLRDDAQALGPPTDDEISVLTARRWPELDRPPSAGTSHAVVLVKTPADDAPARALADELAAALKAVKSG